MHTHENLIEYEEVKGGSNRSFGLLFAVVFVIIALYPLHNDGQTRWWSVSIAAGLLVVSVLRPQLLAPANRLWLGLGLILGKVVNPIVLAVMFFGVITPTAVIMRMLGKDVLGVRADSHKSSYWILREPPGPPPDSMQNQF